MASTQVSSPGRSWASVVSQSSWSSPNTRAARTGLGLPALVLDLHSATQQTKVLVDDPTHLREKIHEALQGDATTPSINIVGMKSTSRITVKVFVDSEGGVSSLRQAARSLDTFPGVKLQDPPPLESDQHRGATQGRTRPVATENTSPHLVVSDTWKGNRWSPSRSEP